MKPCSRCTRLPSRGAWGFESDVPAGYHQLVLEDGWSFCPDCCLAYRCGYEEEWDIVTCDKSWTLARLSPREAAETLPGARGEAAREARPRWKSAARAWVESGTEAARQLAVWILVDEATSAGDVAAVDALVSHADPVVSGAALHELREFGTAGQPLPASPATLTAALKHPDAPARRCAARALTRRVRGQGPEALAPLLTSKDHVVLLAFISELRSLMHEGDTIADLLGPLEALLYHSNRDVRSRVSWAIASAPRNSETRAILRRQAGELAGLIATPATSSEAQCRLQELIRADVDVSPLMPEFFRALVASPEVPGDYQRVLRAIRDKNLDVSDHVGDVLEAVADSRANVDHEAIYLLESLVERGANVAPHRRRILPFVGSLDGHKAERVGRFLGEGLLRDEELAALAALLAHKVEAFRSGLQDAVIARLRPGAGYQDREALREQLETLGPAQVPGLLREELA